VLRQLPQSKDPRLLVGTATADDAGVYRLDDKTALILTLDFFTPIVDDPYTFGQIAAANALSDVYAMGGRPLTALNIVAFPACELEGDILPAILRGGYDKVAEAGAVIAGGHTIDDPEPKYGLSVTGVVHPDKIWTNAGARPGDALILTKPLGTGILATAAKADLFPAGVAASIESMATLNAAAAAAAAAFPIHACTDITGFGLLGHLYEMASASAVRAELASAALPLLPDAADAAAMGLVPAGAYTNRAYLTAVSFAEGVLERLRDLCFDPQTSGGLLLALPAGAADGLLAALRQAGVRHAAVVGHILASGRGEIHVY
jgi:selenide,water dikinase